jgi:SAM-dependent methyltransferase
MTDVADKAQVGAAQAYEDLFVPALFREWAPRVADAARLRTGDRVLDVACGTGVLAREAAARVGTGGFVAGVDPSPGMLAVAGRLAPQVEWHEGRAEALPFADHSFDAIVSQFGLMFFTDRLQALREMRRVLRPGGRIAVAVWDRLDRAPGYAAEVDLLERLAGRAAADAVRAPFGLGDEDQLSKLFADAGIGPMSIARMRGTARFPNIRTMVEAEVRGWLPAVGVTLPEELIQQILVEAQSVLRRFETPSGSAEFEISALIGQSR